MARSIPKSSGIGSVGIRAASSMAINFSAKRTHTPSNTSGGLLMSKQRRKAMGKTMDVHTVVPAHPGWHLAIFIEGGKDSDGKQCDAGFSREGVRIGRAE